MNNTAQQQHSKTAEPCPGVVDWFQCGDRERVEAVIDDLSVLGIQQLRTAFPWTEWRRPEGQAWFDWLIPTLSQRFELLPCFSCTPPSTCLAGDVSPPACEPETFGQFIETMIDRYGVYFQWMEAGNPLDDRYAWDWKEESSWETFSQYLGNAFALAKRKDKRLVLAGATPADSEWLERLHDTGVLAQVDALGLSGFPGTWDFEWQSWPAVLNRVKRLLDHFGVSPELWITSTGYSTWRHDQVAQARKLVDAARAPVNRVYWYSARDLIQDQSEPKTFGKKRLGKDERCYCFGLKNGAGEEKFAFRIWRERGFPGLAALTDTLFRNDLHPGEALVRSFQRSHDITAGHRSGGPQEEMGLAVIAHPTARKPVLITGGAGFVGSNLASRLAAEGREVVILDNLHRPGVERNLEALLDRFGKQIRLEMSDVRDFPAVRKLVQNAAQVYHFAAQVAVTTSLEMPREDFDVNLNGTLNVLESLREMESPPPLLFTSTNKVYGALDDVGLQRINGRYQPMSEFFSQGISEQQALDFHSPYGCSKGAADQYVLDYARSYNLPAAVFRMSCVYGPHQFGTEDQGWVAHFLIQALKGRPLTLYGDGHQVRDLLFVEDLVDAMMLAQRRMSLLSGRAFNMGGGAANSTSLLELLERIEGLTGHRCQHHFSDWRMGDQRYYISNTQLFQELTGWEPSTDIDTGLRRLYGWLENHLFTQQENRLTMPTGEGALQHGKFS